MFFFFFQAEDGIRDLIVTGVQTCALPIYRHRNAKSRSPCCSRDGLPIRRHPRAGVWSRLRRRRVGFVDRVAPRTSATGYQRAVGDDRALHACASPRRTHQGQHCCRQPVRRRRSGGDIARRRWRCDAGREFRRAPLARHARHHGLECRSGRLRCHLPPYHPRFRHRASQPRRDADSGSHAAVDGRHRPVHLPSRRHQGRQRAGDGIFTQSRDARPRTAGSRRLRQYVSAHGVVRTRTRARQGTAGKVAVDGARARLHRKLRHAAARRVTSAELILGLVTLQRAGELVLSRYNTHRLLARGAVEIAPRHYLLIVAVHAAWLISLWVFGHDRPVNGVALLVYLVLQGFRFWVMRTLGSRWTTRIIVLPEQPLVSAGPYRFLSHPNYAVVAAEIAVLPLVLGLPLLAVLFTVLNAAVLAIRIRSENRALAAARETIVRGT